VPPSLVGDSRFCRLVLGHDPLWVFAFSVDGDTPMVGTLRAEPEGIETLVNRSTD
jgi:hypothetical protein